jgi:NAD(P)-dependent dehydrogenase (short-subunit alcohol dehydrogenase family)
MTFWEDKVAVVTGGSSGIGRASALLFAERGARIVVADLDEEAGRKTVEEVGGPERAIFVPADTTSQEDVTKLIQITIDTFGRVDVLHNNAAIIERYDHIESEPV